MKRTIYLKILIVALLIGSLYQNLLIVHADDESDFVIEREEWSADDRILAAKEKYSFPNRVIIVLLNNNKSISSDGTRDIKELYYYFSTRSGFGDLPFHYLVLSDSKVYAGNKLGDEAGINLGDTGESILIAYIQDESNRLTISGVDPLKSIILKIINKYAIDPESIEVKELTYNFGEKVKLEDVELKDPSAGWQDDLELLKQALKCEYNPSEILFKAELVNVVLTEEAQEPASTAEVKVEVKNTGDFNIYSSLGSNIFIVTNNPFDEKSLFYIQDEWASFSRIALLDEGERLASGETKVFAFNVFVPLFPPEKSEDFVLVDPKGNIIEGTDFEITLKINQTDETIIEITDTPVGYLNVRSTPGLGEVVTKVSPGERFIAEEYEAGYYKIQANGKEGWVVNTYVKVVR